MTLTGTWINLGQAVGWWIRLLSFFFVDAQMIFTFYMLCQSLVIILCLSYENAEPVKARVSRKCEWKQQLIRILLLFRLLSAFYQPTIKHQLAFLWKVQLGLPLRGICIKPPRSLASNNFLDEWNPDCHWPLARRKSWSFLRRHCTRLCSLSIYLEPWIKPVSLKHLFAVRDWEKEKVWPLPELFCLWRHRKLTMSPSFLVVDCGFW